MAKWQRKKINIRKDLGKLERESVGLEIIEHIKNRTAKGLDKSGNPWKGKAGQYSKSYKKSLDYKIAGKSGLVNLELSSEMLNSMKILSHKRGEVVIGYDKNDSELNAKVEGNRLGTYGQSKPIRGKKRDFLGIERSKLVDIQNKYDFKVVDRGKIKDRIDRITRILGS